MIFTVFSPNLKPFSVLVLISRLHISFWSLESWNKYQNRYGNLEIRIRIESFNFGLNKVKIGKHKDHFCKITLKICYPKTNPNCEIIFSTIWNTYMVYILQMTWNLFTFIWLKFIFFIKINIFFLYLSSQFHFLFLIQYLKEHLFIFIFFISPYAQHLFLTFLIIKL